MTVTASSSQTAPATTDAGGCQEDEQQLAVISVASYRDRLSICSYESLALLEDAIDFDDYKVRLRYFWAYIFVIVRNLKSKERQDIFSATVPLFVQKGDMRIKLEMEFDSCYRTFQTHFIKQVEKYGRRWITSEACIKFREAEALSRSVLYSVKPRKRE